MFFKFGKNKKIISSYPARTKTLPNSELTYFEYLISQHKHLSSKYKTSPTYLEAFLNRYDQMIKKKEKIDVFLKAEKEAVEIFKKKREEKKKRKENEIKNKKTSIKNKSTKIYPRVFIHADADEKLECLYGCLIDFEKNFSNGLLQSTKVISETEYQQIVYSIKYGLEDFTQTKNKFLPFYFLKYSFQLDREPGNRQDIENQIIEKITLLINKVKKTILWVKKTNKEDINRNPFSKLPFMEDRINFYSFFEILNRENTNIINYFHLVT
jgi:hypothetical protein